MQKTTFLMNVCVAALLIFNTAFSEPKLHVDGNKIVNSKNQTVVLKGVNLSGYESLRRPWVTAAVVKHICMVWKANVIRLPLNADFYITNTELYVSSVKGKVTTAGTNGAWVILDYHWSDENVKQESLPDVQKLKTFWTKVATDYKDIGNVIYDIYNEPKDVSWGSWKSSAEAVISAVKAIDPTAIFVVSGTDWGYNLDAAASSPIDANVIYSSHHYPWKGGASSGAYQSVYPKYPVLIGEFGYCNSTEGCPASPGGDEGFITSLLSYINPKFISYTAWNFDYIGNPIMLTSRTSPYPRNSFGNIIYDDVSKSNLVRYVPDIPVKAKIVATPISGPAPLDVSFSATSSTGTNLTYKWDFGDGTTGTSSTATNKYATAKTYTVKLTVTSGTTSDDTTIQVTATGTTNPVLAKIIATPTSGTVPLTVSFDGSGSTGTNLTYKWDFGDGTSGTSSTASVKYTTAKTYTVKLTVKSGADSNSTTTQITTTPVSVIMSKPGLSSNYFIHRNGDFLTVNLPVKGAEWSYTLSSISGKVITLSRIQAQGVTQLRLPSNLSSGTYIVEMKSKETGEAFCNLLLQN